MKMILRDLRVSHRALINVATELHDIHNQELLGISRLTNLSELGAGMESTSVFRGRDVLVVRVLLGDQVVSLPIQVVWAKQGFHIHEYGVRFDELAPGTISLIRRQIQNTHL